MRAVLIATLPLDRASRVRRSRWPQVAARLQAGRLDRELESGARIPVDTLLAVHAQRITGPAERARLCAGLRRVQARAVTGCAAVPLQRRQIRAEDVLVDEIAGWLSGPLPVRARGMARLRMLLTDGAGPLYRTGTGSLPAALRGVIAAL